jgi:hypothetical protein
MLKIRFSAYKLGSLIIRVLIWTIPCIIIDKLRAETACQQYSYRQAYLARMHPSAKRPKDFQISQMCYRKIHFKQQLAVIFIFWVKSLGLNWAEKLHKCHMAHLSVLADRYFQENREVLQEKSLQKIKSWRHRCSIFPITVQESQYIPWKSWVVTMRQSRRNSEVKQRHSVCESENIWNKTTVSKSVECFICIFLLLTHDLLLQQ